MVVRGVKLVQNMIWHTGCRGTNSRSKTELLWPMWVMRTSSPSMSSKPTKGGAGEMDPYFGSTRRSLYVRESFIFIGFILLGSVGVSCWEGHIL